MPYDPFYIPTDPTDSEAENRKLVFVRKPSICDVPLTPLEWNSNELGSRKRHKPDTTDGASNINNLSSKRSISEQQWSDNHLDGKEVIKVVEKVVSTEPVTIMGLPPLVDDRVRYVVNFILEHVTTPHVEIEAKLGMLIEKEHNMRAVKLVPVLCETPIRSEANKETRFESNVPSEVFTKLNERLNRRVEATTNKEQGRVRYLRTREMDVFWPNRIRETKERRTAADGLETYKTIRVQSKVRLGNLNVLCPGRIADIRYSASSEKDCSVPPNSSVVMRRSKDRISYKYEYLSVDITSVEKEGGDGADRTFEVEVEIDATTDLYGQVCKYKQGDGTSKLFDIAASLVNTVRLLLED